MTVNETLGKVQIPCDHNKCVRLEKTFVRWNTLDVESIKMF